MPKTICAQCVHKLNDTFLFFETCSKAQATLQLLYGVSAVKTIHNKSSPPADGSDTNGTGNEETSIKLEPELDALASLVQVSLLDHHFWQLFVMSQLYLFIP